MSLRTSSTYSSTSSDSTVSSISSGISSNTSSNESSDNDRKVKNATKRFAKLESQIDNEKKRKESIKSEIDLEQKKVDKYTKKIKQYEKKVAKHENKKERLASTIPSHRKSVIRDKDCANVIDNLITYQRIPKLYAMYLKKQCYDARGLKTWIEQQQMRNMAPTLPHDPSYVLTPIEIERINKKAQQASPSKIMPSKSINTGSLLFENVLRWSPDGTKIAVKGFLNKERTNTNEFGIQIWNASNGRLFNTLAFNEYRNREWSVGVVSIVDFDWSPNGEEIVVYENNDCKRFAVSIWNVNSGIMLRRKEIKLVTNNDIVIPDDSDRDHGVHGQLISWSPDGAKIALQVLRRYGNIDIVNNKIYIFDAITGNMLHNLRGHASPINSIAWNSAGTHVVSVSEDKSIRIWNISDGKLLREFQEPNSVKFVSWSPDGLTIVVWDTYGTFRILNAFNGTIIKTFKVDGEGLQVSPNGTKIAARQRNKICIYNATDGKKIYTLRINDQTFGDIFWCSDGSKIAAADFEDETNIIIWNIPEVSTHGGKSTTIIFKGQRYNVHKGARNGRFIIVGDIKRKVYI